MKLQILSDLHLEAWNYKVDLSQFECDSDMIVLAGDIGVGDQAIHWAEELGNAMGKRVIFVAGNHEFYKHDINEVRNYYQSFSDNSNHVIYLDNNRLLVTEKDTVLKIVGGTLWTNYQAFAGTAGIPLTMMEVFDFMNDHCVIRKNGKMFMPEDAVFEFHKTVSYIRESLISDFDEKIVVVTHHDPSISCKHEYFGHNNIGAFFYNNLDYLIKDSNNLTAWIYGHTHSNFDGYVGGTRLVSNQLGYNKERMNKPFDPKFIIEV